MRESPPSPRSSRRSGSSVASRPVCRSAHARSPHLPGRRRRRYGTGALRDARSKKTTGHARTRGLVERSDKPLTRDSHDRQPGYEDPNHKRSPDRWQRSGLHRSEHRRGVRPFGNRATRCQGSRAGSSVGAPPLRGTCSAFRCIGQRAIALRAQLAPLVVGRWRYASRPNARRDRGMGSVAGTRGRSVPAPARGPIVHGGDPIAGLRASPRARSAPCSGS